MIEIYRRSYFSLLDKAADTSGNARSELHEHNKRTVFPFLFENPLNFTAESASQDVPTFSTKYLSEQGWKIFYEEFRHFCSQTFNI